jgi:hypothetical protein
VGLNFFLGTILGGCCGVIVTAQLESPPNFGGGLKLLCPILPPEIAQPTTTTSLLSPQSHSIRQPSSPPCLVLQDAMLRQTFVDASLSSRLRQTSAGCTSAPPRLTCSPPSNLPPTRRGAGDRNIVGDVEHARFVLIRAVGAALGDETQPITK